MATLFTADWQEVELLDAGAGEGALTAAVVRRLWEERRGTKRIAVTAYELDASLLERLEATLADCRHDCERNGIEFSATIFNQDFLAATVPMVRRDLFGKQSSTFNVAIVNPPYGKIRSTSRARLLLRSAGIETSNLYAGFVGLITQLLSDGGELVAITPRSFCNGPYFKPFRKAFLGSMALHRLHVFESRAAAFAADEVLQENVICHAVKGGDTPTRVVISTSSGEPGGEVTERTVEYREVVAPDDPEFFIHVQSDERHLQARAAIARLSSSLTDLGLQVSTGRVVDFRARGFLRSDPAHDTAPLIYPCHLRNGLVQWPKAGARKPNAIVSNDDTRELLVPAGTYVLVKRFTTKEERRRVVACICDSTLVPGPLLGFENHINYFHGNGHGLEPELARGLAAFLNSTLLDVYFRRFSGHTQVNATDLRTLRYPTRSSLERLGRKLSDPATPQSHLDQLVEGELL